MKQGHDDVRLILDSTKSPSYILALRRISYNNNPRNGKKMSNPKQNIVPPDIADHYPVVVIGAGPVGLCASLLLSKYGIQHLLIERRTKHTAHPQAHFIQCRSMEILRELNNLDQEVMALSPNPNLWSRFVYCSNLLKITPNRGSNSGLIAVDDHTESMQTQAFTPTKMAHFSQNRFTKLLHSRLDQGKTCHLLMGHTASITENPSHAAVTLKDTFSDTTLNTEAAFVIAADGAHSATRDSLDIELEHLTQKQRHLVNVHFQSSELGKHLLDSMPAMLYFVYNNVGISVIVAHDLELGEFVAQIPYFPPHQNSADFTEAFCKSFLETITQSGFSLSIKQIKPWIMQTAIAKNYLSQIGRCAVVGDAAHQIPPAGGLGMNLGLQDVHNLVWKLAHTLRQKGKNTDIIENPLIASFEKERRHAALSTAKLSEWNFKRSLAVSNSIGLNYQVASGISDLLNKAPFTTNMSSKLFHSIMKLGKKQMELIGSDNFISKQQRQLIRRTVNGKAQKTLKLVFLNQDLGMAQDNNLGDTGELEIDPFNYTPMLTKLKRLPHFWVVDHHGDRLSSIDIINQINQYRKTPIIIQLIVGKNHPPTATRAQTLNTPNTSSHYNLPTTKVFVSTRTEYQPLSPQHYVIKHPLPNSLPEAFQLFVRPDGIIQEIINQSTTKHSRQQLKPHNF